MSSSCSARGRSPVLETIALTWKDHRDREWSWAQYFEPGYSQDEAVKQLGPSGCEPELAHLLCRALKPGDVAVDGGASIGYFSMLMSMLVGPGGAVHAFEPHPDTAARLRRNAALNGRDNINVWEIALWDCRRDMTLHTCPEPGLNSLRTYAEATGSRTVQAARLDTIVTAAVPRLIKLDIEGAELPAIKGATGLLASFPMPMLVCELSPNAQMRFAASRKTVIEFLEDVGYDAWLLSKEGKIPTYVPPGVAVEGGPNNFITLFATSEQVAQMWSRIDVDAQGRY